MEENNPTPTDKEHTDKDDSTLEILDSSDEENKREHENKCIIRDLNQKIDCLIREILCERTKNKKNEFGY